VCDKRDRAITFKFCLELHLPLFASGLLQNICLQKRGSLAESCIKQNYCHACHTRFAVPVFPVQPPAVTVHHAMLKITKLSVP